MSHFPTRQAISDKMSESEDFELDEDMVTKPPENDELVVDPYLQMLSTEKVCIAETMAVQWTKNESHSLQCFCSGVDGSICKAGIERQVRYHEKGRCGQSGTEVCDGVRLDRCAEKHM